MSDENNATDSNTLEISSKKIRRRKNLPKEAIIDAIMDADSMDIGDDLLMAISEQTGADFRDIANFVGTPEYEKLLKKRCAQRGYDSIRTQEEINEIQQILIRELRRRLRDKKKVKVMKDFKIVALMSQLQKMSRGKSETEANQKAVLVNKPRISNPEEFLAKMLKSHAGRLFLEKAAKVQQDDPKVIEATVIDGDSE